MMQHSINCPFSFICCKMLSVGEFYLFKFHDHLFLLSHNIWPSIFLNAFVNNRVFLSSQADVNLPVGRLNLQQQQNGVPTRSLRQTSTYGEVDSTYSRSNMQSQKQKSTYPQVDSTYGLVLKDQVIAVLILQGG